MYHPSLQSPVVLFFQHNLFWIIPLGILDLILRALALWKSARKNDRSWFICLIIFNSLGILPAIYLLFFSKTSEKKKKS